MRGPWWRRLSLVLSIVQVILVYRLRPSFMRTGVRSEWWWSANQAFSIVMVILRHRHRSRHGLVAFMELSRFALLGWLGWRWARKQRAMRQQGR